MEFLHPDRHREYLTWQVKEWISAKSGVTEIQVSWDGDLIVIRSQFAEYKEPVFDKEPLTAFLDSLESASDQIQHATDRIHSIPFCAALDWLWREQYLDPEQATDKHDRIIAKNIFPHWRHLLKWPVMDMLLLQLLKILGLSQKPGKEVIFTCDYDIADFWGQIGPLRSVKHILGTLKVGGFSDARAAVKSFQNRNRDLEWNGCLNRKMFSCTEEKQDNLIWRKLAFLLIHQSDPEFDPQNNISTPVYKQFLHSLKMNNVEIGLHPSYLSRRKSDLELKEQLELLQQNIDTPVKASRFHYLNADLPHDFLLLERAGLLEDYSYAFADDLLFRGGRSFPCRYWNFEENRGLKLVSFPLTLMDTTLVSYLGSKANDRVESHLNLAWEYGNSIDVLFHNQYFDPFIRYPDSTEVKQIFETTCNHLQALAIGKIQST